ncbi:MAG: AAA family ATPase [Patescibacteria group bacterium]
MTKQQALGLAILIGVGLLYWWSQKRAREGGSGGVGKGGSILEAYTHDLTKDAEEGKLDIVIGRDEEIDRMIHILSRRSKNNPLLLGEPGVGKTAVVEGIARKIAAGDVPPTIKTKRVLGLDLGALIGGTKYRGEFEERMKRLTVEIKEKARSIILFIDEVHMVGQAKGAEGAINVSDIIKPALARGDLQMIGATTWREYEMYIKTDDALNRRLQPVIVGEPSDDATMQILNGIKSLYEKHHGVLYSPEALKASIALAKKYIQGRFLPDKAIDLIDEAGAKVAIETGKGMRHAMGLLHAAGVGAQGRLATLQREESRLSEEITHVQSLEQELQGEQDLVDIRQRMEKLLTEIKQVARDIKDQKNEGAPTVTDQDIREIVSDWVGKPLKEIV